MPVEDYKEGFNASGSWQSDPSRCNIFVSYAHIDNEPIIDIEDGWVSLVIKDLRLSVAQKVGRNDAFSFWMDYKLKGNEPITPAIENAIKNSDILLIVLSRGYLQSPWCQEERSKFVHMFKMANGFNSHIFVMEIDNIGRNERPEELRDLTGYKFWCQDRRQGVVHKLGHPKPGASDKSYIRALDHLSHDLAQCIVYSCKPTCNRILESKAIKRNIDELSEKITYYYHLRDIVLVGSPRNPDKLYEELGRGAAQYFFDNIPDGSIVGVTCGRTIYELAKALPNFLRKLDIYPISFHMGYDLSSRISTHVTMYEICRRNPLVRANHIPLIPLYRNFQEREMLEQRPDVSELLQNAHNPTAAFFSVGHLGPGSSFYWAEEYIRKTIPSFTCDDFKDVNACGEINWYPYKINGNLIEHPIAEMCSSLSLVRIRELAEDNNRHIVLVGGGDPKRDAILGALRGRYLNVLITDVNTAAYIAEYMEIVD